MIQVTLQGANPSDNPMKRFTWLKAATAWADQVGPIGRALLKEEAPTSQGRNAGQLRQKIRYDRRTTAGSVRLEYGTGVGYARYVVKGTSPHLIRAVAARALRFQGQSGIAFARVVHHPGTRANDFPARAMLRLEPVAQERLVAIMRELGG